MECRMTPVTCLAAPLESGMFLSPRDQSPSPAVLTSFSLNAWPLWTCSTVWRLLRWRSSGADWRVTWAPQSARSWRAPFSCLLPCLAGGGLALPNVVLLLTGPCGTLLMQWSPAGAPEGPQVSCPVWGDGSCFLWVVVFAPLLFQASAGVWLCWTSRLEPHTSPLADSFQRWISHRECYDFF